MPSSDTTEQVTSATLADVIAAFESHYPDGDSDLLRLAHETAERAHEGQTRKNGDPYITHPTTVAFLLAQYGLDADTIAAAFLHDTVE
ncbi:MAG TPA: HD domain-containing protein, partial [Acidimicrobiia bacterium]